MNLPAIKQIATAEFADKRSAPYNERGDKFAHGERVAKLAVRLRQLIFPCSGGNLPPDFAEDDNIDDILTVAAWFHDVRNGIDGTDRRIHAEEGAKITRQLLAGHCTVDELEQICGIISVHDDRKPDGNTYSNAVKLHQDADHLDHFATLGIWRFTLISTGHNQTINEGLDYIKQNRAAEVAKWSTKYNFELSKRIFDDKMRFEDTYFERFFAESEGRIWNEDEIAGQARNDSRGGRPRPPAKQVIK